jgi:hypothetical protein
MGMKLVETYNGTRLPTGQKLVLNVLAMLADDDTQTCETSTIRISGLASMRCVVVEKQLDDLQEMGLITISGTMRSRYTVAMHEPNAFAKVYA